MSAKGKKSDSVDFSYLGDKRLEKAKKSLKEEEKSWKGGSHKEKQEQRDTAKALKKVASKRTTEKVSWKKKVAGIGAITFLCGIGFFNFVSIIWGLARGDGTTALDVQDTAKLKDVLFGGDPWLIYCVNNETRDQPIPKVLEESTRSLWSSLGVQTGVLACWDRTESGRSIAQRFKMKMNPPLAFVVANGNQPRTLNMVGVSKSEDLLKKIKPALPVEVGRIDSLKKWTTLCASRRSCIVVGHKNTAQRDTAMNLVRPFVEKHRGVKFVTLDTDFWQLKLGDALTKTRPKVGHADVICLAREDSKGGNGTHSGLFLEQLSSSAVSGLITACESRSGLVRMDLEPRLKARPSKPKKVTPPSPPASRPPSPPPRAAPKREKRTNVDRVGSRASMESEEDALFEAVEEEPEGSEDADEADEADGTDEDADGDSAEDESGEEVEL